MVLSVAMAVSAAVVPESFTPARAAAAETAAAPAGNLIVNGSFENPSIWQSNSLVEYNGGSTAMPGWTVGGNSVDLTAASYWTAEDGNQSLDLAGSASGSVAQTVTTTPGKDYTLSWYLAGNTNCGQAVKTLAVSWDGALADALAFDTTGHGNQAMGWVRRALIVKATGSSSVVGFADATPDNSQCGAVIDSVSLVPTDLTPRVSLSSPAAGAKGVTYTAQFTMPAALAAGTGTLKLTAPAGTVLPAAIADIDDLTTGQDLGGATGGTRTRSGATGTWTVPAAIAAGDVVDVTLAGVTNPPVGRYSLVAGTSAGDATVTTAAYNVTAPRAVASPAVSFAQPPLQHATGVTYPVQFTTSPSGDLEPGVGTITVTAPKGTPLPAVLSDVYDATTQTSLGQFTGGVLTNGGSTGTWTVPTRIPAGHVIDLSLAGLTNPAAGSYRLAIRTSSDTASASAAYTILDPAKIPYLTGTVRYSGGAISGSVVQACSSSTCLVAPAQTDGNGGFGFYLPAPGKYTVTAFAPTSNAYSVGQASVGPVTLPAGTKTVNIKLPDLTPPPAGDSFNGTSGSVPVVNWGSSAPLSVQGCAGGTGVVIISSVNSQNGDQELYMSRLTESPAGSGTYAATIPALYPSHGTAQIATQTECSAPTALLPNSGPAQGGNEVQLTGKGFTGATAVWFGGKRAARFTVASDREIVAVAPAGRGTVGVRVVTPRGTIASASLAKYAYLSVAAVSPAHGPVAGGTRVTITGSGLSDVAAVYFGGAAASGVRVLSATKLSAVAPAGKGSVPVTVFTADGGVTDAGSVTFRYGAAAASAVVVPVRGAAGLPVQRADGPVAPGPAVLAGEGGGFFEAVGGWVEKFNAASKFIDDVAGTCEYKGLSRSLEKAAEKTLKDWVVDTATGYGTTITVNGLGTMVLKRVLGGVVKAGTIEYAVPIFIAAISLGTGLALLYRSTDQRDFAVVADCVEKALPPAVTQYLRGTVTRVSSFFAARIDPSGTVEDTHGNPVAGATVTLLQSADKAGPFTAPSSGSPIMDPSVNPETSDANGVFHWDVYAGWYRVTAQKAGCNKPGNVGQPAVSTPVFRVPPPKVGIVLTLSCPGEAPPPVPVVTGLGSRAGPAVGGGTVEIQGTGFTASSRVMFGTKKARSATVLSRTEIRATAPRGSGTVNVRVRTAGGTSATGRADRYTYVRAPVVRRIHPAAGPAKGGTIVTITGARFGAGDRVSFGRASAAVTVVSSSRILAVSPRGTGPAAVRVTNVDGTSKAVAADVFHYPQRPAFTSAARVRAVKRKALRFTVRARGYPVPVVSWRGRLPRGVKIRRRKGIAVIYGKPAVTGHFVLRMTARNAHGTARQRLRIIVKA